MAELPKIDSAGLRAAKREGAKRVSSVVRVRKLRREESTMAVDLGLTERECCAQAALADDWQKTAILYAAEIEVLRAKLKTCENTARLNLKVATDRGAENGCLKATVMSLEKTILEDHFASPKIRELVVLSEEAADEIERLQKDNKHWQEIASQRIGIERTLRIEIERLQDEVEYWKHADNKRETP